MRHPREKIATREWLEEMEQVARERGFETARWGESEGLPLLGFRRDAPDRPKVYLSAGIHGDEPAGPLAVDRLLRDDLLDPRASWTICPLLNPGGWLAGTRETSAGVDLNRDYCSPRSPETIAHCAWIDRLSPHDLVLSLHEDWEATGFYLYEINASSRLPLAAQILEKVRPIIPIEPLNCIDQHTVFAPGHIAHPPEPDDPVNWPEAIYHCKRYRHLSYTFETPSSLEMETRVAAHIAATTTAVEEFLKSGRAGEPAKQ